MDGTGGEKAKLQGAVALVLPGVWVVRVGGTCTRWVWQTPLPHCMSVRMKHVACNAKRTTQAIPPSGTRHVWN
jgi:hypothetical protein